MATPYERLAAARDRLVAAGIPAHDAAFDAEVLARHALGWDRATLLARGRDPEPHGFDRRFDALVERRIQREPVAQITGVREFWGLEFEVTRDVLVPRPETEIIVEEALLFAREQRCETVIDVGTGSGCVAIAIAHELPGVHVLAVDVSEAALAVAQRNADRLGVASRMTFQQADVLSGIDRTVDLIVSNPPYLRSGDEPALQPEVARFEPRHALFGGPDGLDVINRVLVEARSRLNPGGRLVIEFGLGQDAAVRETAAAAGWDVVRVRSDLQGIPRTILLRDKSRSHD